MDLDHRKSKTRMRKDRIRTICTLDTYDANLADSYFNKENRNRNGPASASHDRSNLRQSKKKSSHHHNKSQFSAFNLSRVRENTPKSLIKRAMSITQDRYSRLRTDYSQYDQVGMHRILGSLKKKLVFATEFSSKLDDLHILRKFHETEEEQLFQVHPKNKKTSKSVMIKTKNASIKKDYERQMKLTNSLVNVIKEKEQKVLLKVEKIIKEKKEWVIFTEHYYHATWEDDRFYLLLSQLKNNSGQLQIIARQLTQAISITSHNGYCHNGISLECLFFPIFKGSLKFETKLKIGNLLNAFQINSKQSFLSMPALYRTPPEILNFIMFEARQIFDRDSLEHISLHNEGWKIDVWAMGVLILQLLNGGPLAGEGSQMGQLIVLQKEILIRYSYLLSNLQEKLKLLLTKMLSPHPNERPHPRDILRIL